MATVPSISRTTSLMQSNLMLSRLRQTNAWRALCGSVTVALAVVIFSVCGTSHAQTLEEFGFTDDREGVEKLLRMLANKEQDTAERYKELMNRLDDERFPGGDAAS